MNLNEALRNHRRNANMTEEELARRLGTSKANISKTETGDRPITFKHLLRVSAVLQLPERIENGLIGMLKRDIKATYETKSDGVE